MNIRSSLGNNRTEKAVLCWEVGCDGSLNLKDEMTMRSVKEGSVDSENILIDLSKMQETDILQQFIADHKSLPIKKIRLNGKILLSQAQSIETLSSSLSQASFFQELNTIHFQHIPFHSHNYLRFFSLFTRWLNPSSSSAGFFSKLHSLHFYDCSFSSPGAIMQLIVSLRGNAFLEDLEITLSHPSLTDEHLEALKVTVTKYQNNLKRLSLGHHSFTAKGTIICFISCDCIFDMLLLVICK